MLLFTNEREREKRRKEIREIHRVNKKNSYIILINSTIFNVSIAKIVFIYLTVICRFFVVKKIWFKLVLICNYLNFYTAKMWKINSLLIMPK